MRGSYVPIHPGYIAEFEGMYLAHSELDGQYFQMLQVGDEVMLGVGWDKYVVTEKIEMQALHPTDEYSPLLWDGVTYTPRQVKEKLHKKDRIILITCIGKNNNPYWGRLIVIAEKQ